MNKTTKQQYSDIVDTCSLFFKHPEGFNQLENRLETAPAGKSQGRQADDWVNIFKSKLSNNAFYHDEPWLTLMALWGLCGQVEESQNSLGIAATNHALTAAFSREYAHAPQFSSVCSVRMEVQLPENPLYREGMKELLTNRNHCGRYHPYADRHDALVNKLEKNIRPSLEGNTNLDALIIANQRDTERPGAIFIEAKFLSDISKDISYAVARNQIARNIDCALDVVTEGGTNLEEIENFWFVLLTPEMFRTRSYRGTDTPSSTYADELKTDRSRLYCYKMEDYTDPKNLFDDLPHWRKRLTSEQQRVVSNRIGWLTFEDILRAVLEKNCLNSREADIFRAFFKERGIWFA